MDIPTRFYRPFCLWIAGWKPNRRPLRWQRTIPSDILAYRESQLEAHSMPLISQKLPAPRRLPHWGILNSEWMKLGETVARQQERPKVRTLKL